MTRHDFRSLSGKHRTTVDDDISLAKRSQRPHRTLKQKPTAATKVGPVEAASDLICELDAKPTRSAKQRDGNREGRLQAAAVAYMRLAAPHALIFSVPNGGWRNKAEASRFKWTGTLAGIPDVCVVTECGQAHFVELKAPGGRLSAAQKKIITQLHNLKTPFAVARSINDVRNAFSNWGIATREVIP